MVGSFVVIYSFPLPFEYLKTGTVNANGVPYQSHPMKSIIYPEYISPIERKETVIPDIPVEQVVYLTFDDGPGKYTKEIAEILENYQSKGSFFWIGDCMTDELGKLGQQMIEQGNVIGSHTMHHDALDKLTVKQQWDDLDQSAKLIGQKTGQPIIYMRPPYGSFSEETKNIATELGQSMLLWDVDSRDWNLAKQPGKILANIQASVKPGAIILLHERKQTVEMLPAVIDYLHEVGYTLAPLPTTTVDRF